MSERWQTDPLGKYCYIKARIGWRGLAASEYTESGPFLIAGKHIESGRIDWDATDHISEFRYNESSEIALAEGDVILSKDGTIGRVARIDSLPGKATINGTMMLVRPVRGIDYRFLYHVLNGAEFKKLIDDKVSGSSIPHIFQRDMVTLPVSFPPIAHQTKLAEVLDTLDTAIHETEAIIAKLKAVKQGLLHDLLTRGVNANGELRPPQAEAPHLYKESPLGWIPKDWSMQPLGYMAEVSRGKFTHRPRNDPRFYGGKHPFIQTGDVAAAEGEYVSTFSQTLSDRGTSVSQEFPAGTIAITIAANIADTAILAIPMFFPDSVVGAVVHDAHSVRFVELSIRKAKRGLDARAPQSAQKNINLQDLRPLLLAVPAREEQDAIAMRYEALQSQLQFESDCLEKYRQERAGLMDDLLTGRVRVTPLLVGGAP
ncbi:restriction endonuclease subunit S [Methylocaldum sp. 14B]|uniref:restriction endonuclease subunit S n=1 Tax=Methylocaldum sp. 14B TaxID=1912213 RepID=UPI00098AF7BD|nr:restriction endonuclease subunit S [Methylocaldum sp. 14B]